MRGKKGRRLGCLNGSFIRSLGGEERVREVRSGCRGEVRWSERQDGRTVSETP